MCPYFCGLLLAYALVLLAVTVLPLLPVRSLVTDTVAHFMPWYPIKALALIVLALLTLAPGAVIFFAALAFLVSAWQLRPFGVLPAPQHDGPRLVILQANMLRTNTDLGKLRALIARHNPDIVCLQEANQAAAGLLDALQGDYPHQHRALQDQHSFGMAVAARAPLQDIESLTFSQPHIPALRFRTALAGRGLEVVCLHPANPLKDFWGRSADYAALGNYLDGLAETPRVVTGDFNVTPFALDYRLFTKKLALQNARDRGGIWRHYTQGTWPQWLPSVLRLSIDHTLHTPELTALQYELLPPIGSDHLPTLTTLAWR